MIFYFSGTGNSKYIAQKLAEDFNDKIVEISMNAMIQNTTYELSEDERVGFVCPVYWYNMPVIVEQYLKKLTLLNYHKQYIYAVATYANSSGYMLNQLGKVLNEKNYSLLGKYGIKMVDNYLIAYDLVKEEKQRQILQRAEKKYEKILPYIKERISTEMTDKGLMAFTTPILKPFYTHANHIKKFYVTNACKGCGKCEKECPCNVISIKEGKPTWSGNCSFCLKCINCCPAEAIQYGKGTENRKRYQYKKYQHN